MTRSLIYRKFHIREVVRSGSPSTVSHSYPKTLVMPHLKSVSEMSEKNEQYVDAPIYLSASEAHHSYACDNSVSDTSEYLLLWRFVTCSVCFVVNWPAAL